MAKKNIGENTAPGFLRKLAKLLVIGGLIGLAAAFILTVEKIEIIKDPSFQPSCNINPIISCGSVMTTPQAEVFGFPNSLLGIIGFTAVAVTGIAILAGAAFRRWYWLALNFGLLLAAIFVHWLIYQTIYNIGALCPYCMVVWTVTIPLFWYVTLYNIRTGALRLPVQLRGAAAFARRHHGDILILWFLGVLAMITTHFWYYWETLI